MLTARRAFLALLASLALLVGFVTPAQATPVTTASIAGTVIMPEGLSVPTGANGLRVESIRILGNGTATLGTAFVNADGTFELSGMVTGQHRLRFFGANINTIPIYHDGSYNYDDVTPLDLVAGENPPIEVQLRRGGSISGSVVGEDGGRVAAGWINVHAAPSAYGRTGANRTIAYYPETSTYIVDTLPPGRYLLRFAPIGDEWLPLFSDGSPFGVPGTIVHTLIEVGEDENVTDVDFALPRTPSIVGEYRALRDESLTGPEPIELTARPFPGTVIGTRRVISVPDQGAFRVPGLGIGQYQLCTSVGGVISDEPSARTCYGQDADNPNGLPITVENAVVAGFDIEVPMRSSVTLPSVRYPNPLAIGELRDVSTLEVIFWRRDQTSGRWLPETSVDARFNSNATSGRVLVGGDYRIEIIFGDHATPQHAATRHRDYWPGGVQSFGEAGVITVPRGAQVDIGEVLVKTFPVTRDRISGSDRFSTAVELSRSVFEDSSSPVVFITNGLNYPDALAAGPAAAASDGLLLLVSPTSIPAIVADELRRLKPSRIVVVGGTASVSAAVESQLRTFVASPSHVTRLSGDDRYATSRAVVTRVFDQWSGGVVFVATGTDYPDALAAGAAAGYFGGPVVLVNGASSTLDTATRNLLDRLDPSAIVISGGPGAVSNAIEVALKNRFEPGGTAVVRLFGEDRYQTAFSINLLFEGADSAYVASGRGFADALAAGPIAAATASPLYLAQPTCIPSYVLTDIDSLLARRTILVGGTGVLSEQVRQGRPC